MHLTALMSVFDRFRTMVFALALAGRFHSLGKHSRIAGHPNGVAVGSLSGSV